MNPELSPAQLEQALNILQQTQTRAEAMVAENTLRTDALEARLENFLQGLEARLLNEIRPHRDGAVAEHQPSAVAPIENQIPPRSGTSNTSFKVKIAQPDKFDGTRSKLDGFLVQVDLNFRMNPSGFQHDEQKIAFVSSYLSGQALQWVTPLFTKNDLIVSNYPSFIDAFKKRFADPDEVRKAERKLENMTQGKRSAAAYAAEFQLEASKTLWDDASKKSRFRAGLRDDVLDLILTIPKNQLETFQDFVDQAISCDDRLFERRQDRSRHLRGAFPTESKIFAPINAHSRATPAGKMTTPHAALSNSGYTGVAPMEIGAIHHQVTEAERQHRRENNLCLYCGQPGHIIRFCPTKPKKTFGQRINTIETNTTLNSSSPPNEGSPRSPRA